MNERAQANGRDTHFGSIRLGYAVIESMKLDLWRKFAAEGIGLHVEELGPHTLSFRVDQHERRILVREGPAEDITSIGWEFDDDGVLLAVETRLHEQGTALTTGSADEARLRGVDRYRYFDGPKGLKMELFTAPRQTHHALNMLTSGFVTGEGGLGHVAVTTRRPEKLIDQLESVFGARVSDRIFGRVSGIELELTFLRLNERHHSVAVAATRGVRVDPVKKRVQHLMLQVASFDDVTEAYARCKALGFRIALGMGQHPNDQEVSFYVVSPSGFEIEIGWNPILVVESDWSPKVYDATSIWGHKPEDATLGDTARRVGAAIASLFASERR
jgi:2,3-dihydroxybiphenyl 1,2-dioxygenase